MDLSIGFVLRQPQLRNIDKQLDAVVEAELRRAVNAGFTKMIENVPVDTGMAVGSLLPVARFANAVGLWQAKLARVGGNNRVADGILLGRPKNPDDIAFKSGNGWVIRFSTRVLHYVYNDLMQRNYPRGQIQTPWRSFEIAEREILRYLGSSNAKPYLGVIDFFLGE